jgi:hypothetical protein
VRDAREYDLFLPGRYNDGSPVEPEKIQRLKQRLSDRFGGLTFFPQKIEGTWHFGAVTFRDELVIVRVLAERGVHARAFFARLKEELKAELRQEEVLVVERNVKVL